MTHDETPARWGRRSQPVPESLVAGSSPDSRRLVDNNQPAQLLLELAGQGTTADGRPSHLTMSNAPYGAKYRTVHRHPTIDDCRRHLAGTGTMGAWLTWGEMCRAIGYDKDNATGYALLERAAGRLRASGAWPLLEQASLPEECDHAGGGKLWLVFEARVRHAWAFGTAEGHAPELRQVRERFPGSVPVRLPGGLYRRGVDIWSELCAFGATDDGYYTGEYAIRTITENLTPAGWVQRIEGQRPSAGGRINDHTLPATIHQGEGRNVWLTRIAGALRRWGLDGELILACLHPINQARCDPPLDDEELRWIAEGMERYPAEAPTLFAPKWRWHDG